MKVHTPRSNSAVSFESHHIPVCLVIVCPGHWIVIFPIDVPAGCWILEKGVKRSTLTFMVLRK